VQNKHSKFKNTGLLFELLVRRITADTLEGKDSAAVDILRKYFLNSELGKEYKLYEQLSKHKNLTESKAELVINSLVETSSKLNRTEVRKQRYNLVREIKENYSVEKFFKVKISNYKIYAALNNLIENHTSTDVAPEVVINNKMTLLEHLSKAPVEEKRDELMEEFNSYDKDLKMLTYRVLLEKFNEKYDDLKSAQKEVLKEFINSVDAPEKLKELYNNRIPGIKSTLERKIKSIEDQVVKIKLQEVLKYVTPLEKNDKFSNDDVVNLLQYYELINEL
jgi:anion-transporting  ArsA/GET3 family ATPase